MKKMCDVGEYRLYSAIVGLVDSSLQELGEAMYQYPELVTI